MSCTNVALGEVADFINGFAFKPADWEPVGRPIIRIQNLTKSSNVLNRTTKHIPERYHVREGELLVSWSASLGVFQYEGEDALVNQHIFRVRENPDRVVRSYLRHMIARSILSMENMAHGSTMKHINRREFLDHKIPLPPLPEQRRIAGILDAADALRRRRREALALLDTLPGAIFAEMFGSKMDGYENVSLGQHEKFLTSGSRGWAKYYAPEGRPFIRIGNVSGGLVSTQELVYVQPPESAEARRTLVEADDILISITADLGRIGVVPEELGGNAHINQHLALFRHDGRFNSEFLAAALLHPRTQAQFTKLNRNGVKAGLNFDDIRSVKVPLPPHETQTEFARLLKKSRAQASIMQISDRNVETLFASLQSRAFAGEL